MSEISDNASLPTGDVSRLAEPARKGQLALFPQDPRRAGMR